MRRTVRATTLATSLVLALGAGSASGITLKGGQNCDVWKKGRSSQAKENYEQAWLVGFLSGLALGLDVEFWGTKQRGLYSHETALAWMDKYCAANPRGTLADGAQKLFIERVNELQK